MDLEVRRHGAFGIALAWAHPADRSIPCRRAKAYAGVPRIPNLRRNTSRNSLSSYPGSVGASREKRRPPNRRRFGLVRPRHSRGTVSVSRLSGFSPSAFESLKATAIVGVRCPRSSRLTRRSFNSSGRTCAGALTIPLSRVMGRLGAVSGGDLGRRAFRARVEISTA